MYKETINNFPQGAPFYVEVLGDLPYYLPIPENAWLNSTLNIAEPFSVEFHVLIPTRHSKESQGEKIDDRLGTYIRSTARIIFPMNKSRMYFSKRYLMKRHYPVVIVLLRVSAMSPSITQFEGF